MTILRPGANVFGFAAAIAVFFGTALSFVLSIGAVHAAIEEATWVRTTGTVVGTVPYHGKKGAVYHYAEYEYELGGEKYRCQGDRGWRDDRHAVGGTTELLVNPEPPHTVRFGSPAERWTEQAGRIGLALAVLAVGWVVGTVVKRIDPPFEHHPTQMAAITFMMLTLLFVPVSCAGLIGAGRRDGKRRPPWSRWSNRRTGAATASTSRCSSTASARIRYAVGRTAPTATRPAGWGRRCG